jgi:hypothetical protein
MSREQRWAADSEPLKVGSDKPCKAQQKRWPHKICNRDKRHTGDHCCTTVAGSAVVEIWWKEGE